MKFKVKLKTEFDCSPERAFKTPMLCDVTKVHTGFWLMPAVTHCTDDAHWGKPGSTKKVWVAASPTQKGGFASVDHVIERIENKYWKIEVSDFQSWMLGFYKFTGEWETNAISANKVQVYYTYTLDSQLALLWPLNWLFAKIFWKRYMIAVVENIREMIKNNEPYQYD